MNIRIAGSGLNRRHVLKGLGASLGLPFLECMQPVTVRGSATKKPPVRMAFLYMPNGIMEKQWTPTGEGSAFELSPTLSPLAAHRDRCAVLSNLWNKNATAGDGHYVKTSGWLTGTTITKTVGNDLRSGGPSMDQVFAQHAAHDTRLPSLELGIEPITSGVDRNVGYTRLYGSHISWKSSTTPLPAEISPRHAFNRLFRANGFALHQSVVDLVKDDAERLRQRLGTTDRQKVDEYLESIRAIEQRISRDEDRAASGELTDPAFVERMKDIHGRIDTYDAHRSQADHAEVRRSGEHTEQVRLMLDIIALAFYGDVTRVSTFMFGNAVSGRNFSFLEGVQGGHHEISHHQNDAQKLAEYQKINQWHIAQFAYLLDRMASLPEGEGSLLDHSMVLFGAGMRDGNAHNPENLPLVLAGKGGGAIRTGQHLVSPRKTPFCNLLTSMLQVGGLEIPRFSDATGPLAGLTA